MKYATNYVYRTVPLYLSMLSVSHMLATSQPSSLYLTYGRGTSTCLIYKLHLLQGCHPACGHEGSSHIAPVIAMRFSVYVSIKMFVKF